MILQAVNSGFFASPNPLRYAEQERKAALHCSMVIVSPFVLHKGWNTAAPVLTVFISPLTPKSYQGAAMGNKNLKIQILYTLV